MFSKRNIFAPEKSYKHYHVFCSDLSAYRPAWPQSWARSPPHSCRPWLEPGSSSEMWPVAKIFRQTEISDLDRLLGADLLGNWNLFGHLLAALKCWYLIFWDSNFKKLFTSTGSLLQTSLATGTSLGTFLQLWNILKAWYEPQREVAHFLPRQAPCCTPSCGQGPDNIVNHVFAI